MGGIGISEVLLIGLIIMLLFGARRLPGIARSLGASIYEFKKVLNPAGSSRKEISRHHQQSSEDTPVKKE
jgi:sec-independent protein translocase protein TatA